VGVKGQPFLRRLGFALNGLRAAWWTIDLLTIGLVLVTEQMTSRLLMCTEPHRPDVRQAIA
jgi:hypothetical protein